MTTPLSLLLRSFCALRAQLCASDGRDAALNVALLTRATQVGKNGLTPGVAQSLDEALTAHEIVKVKVGDASEDDSEDVAEALAAQLRASVAGRVGGTVLFVRLRPRGEGAPSVIRPLLDARA